MSPLTYFFSSVRGFWVGHMVKKLVKIVWNMTFWALFEHFHFKKIEMNPFSGSTILWSIWENMSHVTYFVGSVRGFLVGHMVPKLAKIACNTTFWELSNIFTPKKIEINPFTGSTILWSILGDFEPCNVLCWYCTGLLSGSYGPKIGQNCMKYDILGTFQTFSLRKKIEMR